MVCFLDCKQKAALWSQQASGLARSRGKAEVCETELNWFWLLPHSHIGMDENCCRELFQIVCMPKY